MRRQRLEIRHRQPDIFCLRFANVIFRVHDDMTDTSTASDNAPAASGRETLGFQAEVKQLLHLMVHSLYSNKEIFLRELISNASDACDKLRFEALSEGSLFEGEADLVIDVGFDPAARTITIADNGVGMTRQEVIDNLGTIAKSGTREFLSRLSGDQARDANLIGQFGVGFYSAFIIADRVAVSTRRAGAPAGQGVLWQSTGDGEYTLEPIERAARGTEVTLHLRDGEDDFLDAMRLRNVIRKYSDHITLPVRMHKQRWDAEKSGYVTESERETVNQASALWSRPKADITDEQYNEFYKHVAHDYQDPLDWAHARVEGKQEYTHLLYVPSRAPFDLYDRQHKRGLKLYVRRVFIMDDAEQLLPAYLRFVRGVVDSNDLPLNVSREILQQSRDIDAIRAGCTRRVLSMLDDLAENQQEKYTTFWTEFGKVLKEGVGEDLANRERVAKLCRFATTQSGSATQEVSLADYVGRMKPGQEKIYYITADSHAAASNSPHLEVFRKKGIEVLLLADRVDEWMISNLPEYDGKALVSVARGQLDLGALEDEAEKVEQTKTAEAFKPLVDRIKAALGERAKDVRVTLRLTDSPACLVVEEGDMGMNLERLLKAAGQSVGPGSKPILEVNPHHALVERLAAETDDDRFADWANLMFEQATLAEGGQLDDPGSFVRRLNGLMLALAAGGKEPSRIITP
jgi:molecular chaperone HtpG